MFYERLNLLCLGKGLKITSFSEDVLHVSNATPTNWKKGVSPKASVVADAARFFDVTADYLIGLSDCPHILGENAVELSDEENVLIRGLRNTDAATRTSIYKMASAVLTPTPIRAEEPAPRVFLAPKGDSAHRKRPTAKSAKKVLGDAAAGRPIEAVPDEDTRISVPAKYLSDRYFIVRARGDSMTGSGIDDGDYCVFDSQAPRDEGAVMLVFVDGLTDRSDGAIKRVFSVPGDDPDGSDASVRLVSTNRAYAPMVYPADEVSVTGVLVDILDGSEIV